eukprot:722568-Amphidinium_carterae.1
MHIYTEPKHPSLNAALSDCGTSSAVCVLMSYPRRLIAVAPVTRAWKHSRYFGRTTSLSAPV